MATELSITQAEQISSNGFHSLPSLSVFNTLFGGVTVDDADISEGWKRIVHSLVGALRQSETVVNRAEETIANQKRRIAQLESLSTTDELTGLKNRRGFYETFLAELDRCDRGLLSGGLLMLIDLDNFKSINDSYGHQAGDACLRLVAQAIESEIRIMDTAARLGGDEFVILLSTASKDSFAARAQRVGARLNTLSLVWEGNVIPVRASVGLRSYRKGDSAETVLNSADNAMYANKKRRQDAERVMESA